MNQPISEKEKLMMVFSELSDQLAELESVLKKSFSDLHKELILEEEGKLAVPEERISLLESQYMNKEDVLKEKMKNYSFEAKSSAGLKFEFSFNQF